VVLAKLLDRLDSSSAEQSDISGVYGGPAVH
jgi:hypothetical protein